MAVGRLTRRVAEVLGATVGQLRLGGPTRRTPVPTAGGTSSGEVTTPRPPEHGPRYRRAGSTEPGRGVNGSTFLPGSVPESKPPATFISDLRPSRVATIEATVSQLDAVREFETRDGRTTSVRNARLKDPTGEIALVLWGSEVELVNLGDRVRITEGWVKDYQGRPQISLGRTGKLEKLGSD